MQNFSEPFGWYLEVVEQLYLQLESRHWNWISGCFTCFWINCSYYGLCCWTYFWWPFYPAVTLGLWASGRFHQKEILPYILSQVLGATAAATVLYIILNGGNAFSSEGAGAFATNFYESPVYNEKSFSMLAAFCTEFVLTLFFLLVILGATDKVANGKFAGIAIGLALTLIHLISIPITNTSVNPARSTSQALFVQGEALSQLWLFWVAPIAGAIVGGILYKNLLQNNK